MRTPKVIRAMALMPPLLLGACEQQQFTKIATPNKITRTVGALYEQTKGVCNDKRLNTFYHDRVMFGPKGLNNPQVLLQEIKEIVAQNIPKKKVGTKISIGLRPMPGGYGIIKIGGISMIPSNNIEPVMAYSIKPNTVKVSIGKDVYTTPDRQTLAIDVIGCGENDQLVLEKAKGYVQ